MMIKPSAEAKQTAEWTVETVDYFLSFAPKPGKVRLVGAINAATAKLREELAQYKNLQGQGWFHPDIVNGLREEALEFALTKGKEIAHLRAQLAESNTVMTNLHKVLDDLRAQLAAERQRRATLEEQSHSAYCVFEKHANDLRAQLAAAREALEWYATATYPDDGSGRPPGAFQRRAKEALSSREGGAQQQKGKI